MQCGDGIYPAEYSMLTDQCGIQSAPGIANTKNSTSLRLYQSYQHYYFKVIHQSGC